MDLELRDAFALEIARALAKEEDHAPRRIAERAYAIADALVAERGRTLETAYAAEGGYLLDEPAPMSAERWEREEAEADARDEIRRSEPPPSWLDRDISAELDLEPHWSAPPSSDGPRPGLRKTAPGATVPEKKSRFG